MNGPDLISIIVAAYNSADVLPRMMRCLLGQTYENLEVILIDDGSDDDTAALCDAFAAADGRVAAYHLPRSGVACARNFGLDHMHGRYYSFADADDLMDIRLYERLYELLNAHDVALSACMALDVEGSAMQDSYVCDEPGKAFVVTSDTIDFTEAWSHRVIWGALFDIEAFRGIRFDEGLRVSTDTLYIAQCLLVCDSMVQSTERLYCYGLYEHSNLHGSHGLRRYDEALVWRRIRALYESRGATGRASAYEMAYRVNAASLCRLMEARKTATDPRERADLDAAIEETCADLRSERAALREGLIEQKASHRLFVTAPKLAARLKAFLRPSSRI